MSVRYMLRHLRADIASDDVEAYEQKRLDVIVAEHEAVDTGLVDQHGTPIMRVSARGPLGFCR